MCKHYFKLEAKVKGGVQKGAPIVRSSKNEGHEKKHEDKSSIGADFLQTRRTKSSSRVDEKLHRGKNINLRGLYLVTARPRRNTQLIESFRIVKNFFSTEGRANVRGVKDTCFLRRTNRDSPHLSLVKQNYSHYIRKTII